MHSPVYTKYYVEYHPWPEDQYLKHIRSIYVYAYSPEQVWAMLGDYKLLTIDETD